MSDNDKTVATPTPVPENLVGFVTWGEDRQYTLKLEYPVTLGSERIDSISGRRPSGRHMRDVPFQDQKAGHYLDLFARSTGTVTPVIDQFDAADVLRIVALMSFFMGGGRGTGPT